MEKREDRFSIKLSTMLSSIMRFLGIISLTVVDVALGGFTIMWLINQLTPESFHLVGTIIAWAISIILFTMVSLAWKWMRSVNQKSNLTKLEIFASLLLPLLLNALDSIVDATAAIILFGQGFNLTLAGWNGVQIVIDRMPLIGWIMFFVLFSISFFGELCRIILEDGKL